jgi:hypothetical protein
MSLISSIVRLASTPQGRRIVAQAGRYARSPEGRARIEQVRRQIVNRQAGRRR